MRHIQILAVVTLFSFCRSATVSRHKLTNDIDSHLTHNEIPKRQTPKLKFVSITKMPPAVNPHTPGTTVELTCEVMGAPAPTVHWFKNDVPVFERDIESTEILDVNPTSMARVSSTLLIRRTADRDVYTCLVHAGHKTARATTLVYSTGGGVDSSERSKLVPLAPQIVVFSQAYLDVIGNDIVLPCRAKGHPRPEITWKDNKGAIVKNGERMKILRSGELVIPSVQWEDMGEFTCKATNIFGSKTINTFVYPARPEKPDN